MDSVDIEDWKLKLEKALNDEGIVDPDFYNFMRGKVKRLSLKVEDFEWGVFPLVDKNGVLTDIRMVVPVVYDTKSLCVNLHEYTHAYEAYSFLGKVYVWSVDESEKRAVDAEKRYLKSLYKKVD